MPNITFAENPEDLPSRTQTLSMSGLEFIQAMLKGDLPAAPIARTLGFHLFAAETGQVTFRGTPDFNVLNPVGAIHGGWYGAMLDSALGCAVMTTVPKGSVYTTLEYKVNLIRAIPPGTEVDCTAQTDHAGRSTGVAHGRIIGTESGKLYATGSTTCIIMTP